ncbi:N-acetyltransferase [uncultured Microbulbifer sp.]|uniref:N-acetyltransferase n=1 Tax=uncultured Microbulbifer sp. TaxID=348147 RepID=UPI00262BDCE3|nr:N-acetyltransferase [uncultured Microbulbifer sp.]
MSEIKYLSFNDVDPEDFLAVVNEKALRKHLIDHALFDSISIRDWMEAKIKIESMSGCRVRAIYIGGMLAGWCGIQPDNNGFEFAIVISQKFWGFGRTIFKTLMCWAKELGHKEIVFHLLGSRPEYKALNRIATKVHKTELLGQWFTTYYISIDT